MLFTNYHLFSINVIMTSEHKICYIFLYKNKFVIFFRLIFFCKIIKIYEIFTFPCDLKWEKNSLSFPFSRVHKKFPELSLFSNVVDTLYGGAILLLLIAKVIGILDKENYV